MGPQTCNINTSINKYPISDIPVVWISFFNASNAILPDLLIYGSIDPYSIKKCIHNGWNGVMLHGEDGIGGAILIHGICIYVCVWGVAPRVYHTLQNSAFA